MPDKIDVEEVFDEILLSAKIEQALKESEQGIGEDREDFSKELLKLHPQCFELFPRLEHLL